MKNCFAYVRVSTQKQGVQGVSLQAQRDDITAYASKNNLNITAWFEERESAAKYGNRLVFSDMMKRLKKNEAAAFIVHKIDRSARNLRDWADLGDLLEAGIEIHFALESLDMASRGGRLAADIQAVVAADYSRNLRQEARKGFIGRLKQGYYPLAAPLGYLDMGGGKSKEIDPVAGPLIKRCFELYATGQYSLTGLLDLLRIRNRRSGKLLSKDALSKILKNPFYIGIIRLPKSGEIFKGNHMPLIKKRLFDQVQEVLAGKVRRADTHHAFLYARVFKCTDCGYALTAETQKGHIYYRCHTKVCPTRSLREEKLGDAIDEFFATLSISDQGRTLLSRKVEGLLDAIVIDTEAQRETTNLRLTQIEGQLERLTDAYVDALLEKPVFEERRASLLVQRGEIAADKDDSVTSKTDLRDRAARFFELLESANFSREIATPREKADLLKILSSNRTACAENAHIEPRKPWQCVQNYTAVMSSGPERGRLRTEVEALAEQIVQTLGDDQSEFDIIA